MNVTVWAPRASKVHLVLETASLPMAKSGSGWWSLSADLEEGARYQFQLDDGKPMPDPRSKWQPDGVHGPSRILDTSRLRKRDGAPFKAAPMTDAIIYELHVGTFTHKGTYGAAAAKIPHLVKLGITHVELLPVASFPGSRGWGYDGVALFAPFPNYGSPRELADFVEACHFHGIAVLLDVVYNHLGPDGNYLSNYGPYFTDRVSTPWGEALNCDLEGSDEVRAFIVDNALMWLRDYGFDGLRLDAVHAIHDTRAVHLLEELTREVRELEKQERRNFVVIAESNLNAPHLVRPVEVGGYGLDGHWADELHHAIHVFLTGEHAGYYADFNGLGDLARTFSEGYLFQGQHAVSRGCSHGRPPTGVRPDQLIVCIQNHDQIGNRAYGERLGHLVSKEKLKCAAALLLMSPCVPLLFQGEEWNASAPFLFFSDHESEELRRIIRASRHEEFKAFTWKQDVPDPSDESTFKQCQLDWSEVQGGDHQEILDWYAALISLRKGRTGVPGSLPAATVEWDEEKLWLKVIVGNILAVFNFAEQSQPMPGASGTWKWRLSSNGISCQPDDALDPWNVALFTRE